MLYNRPQGGYSSIESIWIQLGLGVKHVPIPSSFWLVCWPRIWSGGFPLLYIVVCDLWTSRVILLLASGGRTCFFVLLLCIRFVLVYHGFRKWIWEEDVRFKKKSFPDLARAANLKDRTVGGFWLGGFYPLSHGGHSTIYEPYSPFSEPPIRHARTLEATTRLHERDIEWTLLIHLHETERHLCM